VNHSSTGIFEVRMNNKISPTMPPQTKAILPIFVNRGAPNCHL
jgi:hypothetical protein